MMPTSALVALAFVASTMLSPHEQLRDTQERTRAEARPLILLVHGRGYLTRDSAAFRRQALAELRAGTFRAAGDSVFTDGDLRLVWYADLLGARRNSSNASTCENTLRNSDLGNSPASILQTIALFASELLDAGAQDDEKADVKDLAADLRFFGNPATRCAAEGRVADAIAKARDEGRPVILVAHSLGALVTWGHLQHRDVSRERQLPEVKRLVTVGSPIGSGDLRELIFGGAKTMSLPRAVGSWSNIIHPDDPFAARLIVTDSISGKVAEIAGVADVIAQSGSTDPHELRGYLSDPAAAKSILGAWCDALESKSRLAACKVLTK